MPGFGHVQIKFSIALNQALNNLICTIKEIQSCEAIRGSFGWSSIVNFGVPVTDIYTSISNSYNCSDVS